MNEFVIVSVSAIATYFWRGLGVALSAHIAPNGALFRWITCVSYAMLAGLVSRIMILPLGSLADTPLVFRLGAMAVAITVFFLARRRLLPGIVTGVGAFITLMMFA